ncbi:MAG TPA: hypothetical protein VFG11_06630 [Acidobacteriota bacterium]|nr:hypothetical protein [Acidobacteriota bacterium]
MRQFLLAAFLFCVCSALQAITVDQVIQLASSKTSDDLMIQTIRKDPLAQPIGTDEILKLKNAGVSEAVIQELVRQSDDLKAGTQASSGSQIRTYYTTNKDGKQVRMLTNLDDQGKRIGGTSTQEPAPVFELPPPSPEIIVQKPHEPEPEYQEPYPQNGIPLYSGSYYPGGYPIYGPGYIPGGCLMGNCFPVVRPPVRPVNPPPPVVKPTPPPRPVRPPIVQKGSSAGSTIRH